MQKISCVMKIYLTLIIFLGTFFSCTNHRTSYLERMSRWDELLQSAPLSVKDSLKTIGPWSLNKEEQAYYYLLEAAAADKNMEIPKNDSTLLAISKYYSSRKDYVKLAQIQLYLAKYQFLEEKNAEEAYKLLKQAENYLAKNKKEGEEILALVYYWLGQIQHKQNNLEEAEKYYKKSINLYSNLKDSLSTVYPLRQLGRLYINQNDITNAKYKLEQAASIIKELDKGKNSQLTQLHLGVLNYQSYLYQTIQNYNSALEYSKKCISLIESRNYPVKSPYYQTITQIYQQQKSLDSSKYYCNQMLTSAQKENNLFALIQGHKIMFQIEESLGNYKKSCELREKFNELKDELNANSEQEALKELETKYKLAEQEKENLKTKNRSLWIFTLSSILALTAGIVALYFMWRHRKLKARNNRLSEEIKKIQWGFALSKELINDNSSIYEELERLLNRNIKVLPPKIFDEFQESFRQQKNNYSQRLFSALTNIDNNFTEELRKKCPDLNSEEVMLASMIRHQWKASDIAQVFRITFDALKKRKYRLRQKLLGNDTKTLLEDFLNQF